MDAVSNHTEIITQFGTFIKLFLKTWIIKLILTLRFLDKSLEKDFCSNFMDLKIWPLEIFRELAKARELESANIWSRIKVFSEEIGHIQGSIGIDIKSFLTSNSM